MEGVVTTKADVMLGTVGSAVDHSVVQDERSTSELLVRVLGIPRIPQRPALKGQGLALAVYLACQSGSASSHAVQHALWNGRSVHRKRLANVVTQTRRALGTFADGTPAFPKADGIRRGLRLADGVVTDLQLLAERHRQSFRLPAAHAISLLDQAFLLVDGPPFSSPGYEWAHHTELFVAEASRTIDDAAWRLADLALAVGDVALARRTALRGLRSLPGDESLYRLRMRVEHHAGNIAAVHVAYCELLSFLDMLGIGARPSMPTVALYNELISKAALRHAPP